MALVQNAESCPKGDLLHSQPATLLNSRRTNNQLSVQMGQEEVTEKTSLNKEDMDTGETLMMDSGQETSQ